MSFDVSKARSNFPILSDNIIYFDSASTTQKPIKVIESISRFYKNNNANVHRGTYQIAESATKQYELARESIAVLHHQLYILQKRSGPRQGPP